MSSIPYNYGSYIDAKVAMTDTGHVSAGKQIQSPASAGSRGLAKTTQFTNDRTQMQMGNSPIAESMIEIRSILNRIDGVNAPVQEDAGEKIANMAQNMTKDQFMSHADELGLTPEEAAEHYEKMQGGAHVQEGHYPHIKSFDKLYGINDKQQYKAMADDAQSMEMGEFMDTYSSVIDMAGDFWEDHQKTSESMEGTVNEDPNTLAKELASEIMRWVRRGFDHIPADALKPKAREYLRSVKKPAVQEDAGELARLKELSGIEENAKVNFSPEQIKQLMMWNKKYSVYSGKNGDELPSGLVKANTDSGITSDGYEENEVKQYEKMFGKEEFDWDDSQHGEFQEKSKITGGMISDLEKIVGVGNADDEYTLAEIGEKILGSSFGDTYEEQYQPFPEGDEFDIAEDEDFEEVLGPLGFPEDETELFDAEYQGRKVPLNKPMRGDTKKFKVYVKDPKTGNVKKVNFGHGGTSAKRKTMRIRKSNPKARKSFRARHNCANPGPKTKARYWSCRKW